MAHGRPRRHRFLPLLLGLTIGSGVAVAAEFAWLEERFVPAAAATLGLALVLGVLSARIRRRDQDTVITVRDLRRR